MNAGNDGYLLHHGLQSLQKGRLSYWNAMKCSKQSLQLLWDMPLHGLSP